MPYKLLQKTLTVLFKRQTNILSAAFIIMATVIFSQFLGVIRQRLLGAIFGASDTLGVYLASTRLPDLLFQIIFAGALASAFIPVFSDYIAKGNQEDGNKMASSLLSFGFLLFLVVSIPLFIFAPFFLQISINIGSGFTQNSGFTPIQMQLMANLMRVVIIGQVLFIVGTFFQALLQSHNHFFIPGIAAALYNLGVIIGIVTLSSTFGIYAPAYGGVLGGCFFILAQIHMIRRVGFAFKPSFSLQNKGLREVSRLMWPRTFSIAVFQLGALLTLNLVTFLHSSGRNYVIFDYAQTLAFAPTVLIGQSIAQAAFPVLSREREHLDEFKTTFLTSFNQLLYLILPISALFLVLRIPVVRLVFGAGQFDWQATVLMGETLAFLTLSMFSQGLVSLISRGFYALHDTKRPLIVGAITTAIMLALGFFFIVVMRQGIESIALAYSIGSILNFLILFILLDRKTHGFDKTILFSSTVKTFFATVFTGFALYIPIKLLDQLVFDTTKTVNLLLLTGISSLMGLLLYLFLTWFFNVKEATQFILLFKRIGNWREILASSEEPIDGSRLKL